MGSSDDQVSPPSSTGDEASNPSGVGGLIEDLFNDNVAAVSESGLAASKPKKRHYKPKGMLLGTRRDTGDAIDIAPQVLARHGAMLGSTGSGKTVMAKALIEEAALAGIPSLIIDPQGDLARLALGIDLDELEEKDGLVNRAKKLLDTCEVRIWTPLRLSLIHI